MWRLINWSNEIQNDISKYKTGKAVLLVQISQLIYIYSLLKRFHYFLENTTFEHLFPINCLLNIKITNMTDLLIQLLHIGFITKYPHYI